MRTQLHASTPASQPLFVVGMWRSGTSLLYTLLNKHSQISLMYEGDLPVLSPLFVVPRKKENWLTRWDFWNSAVSRHRIDVARIPDGIGDLRTAMEAVYRQYAGDSIWGCKSPNYFDSMTRVAEVFPSARF